MKKSLKSYLIILFTTLTSYFGFANTIDPALVLSYTEPVKDEIIKEITNKDSKQIYLKAGNEKFGLNHILKKHSNKYFLEARQKGSLFPEGTTGKQILKAIESVYNYGIKDPKAYGNKKVLQHNLEINGEKACYRLVINEKNEILTFFKTKNIKRQNI